jgi:hypothetical protein
MFAGRSFCPTCGSRLFFLLNDEVEVFLGILDAAPYDLRPTVEVWATRREPWLAPAPGATQHDQNPPKG